MICRQGFFFSVLAAALLSGCGSGPGGETATIGALRHQLHIDSVRMTVCDSIAHVIAENNSARILLPDIHPRTLEEAVMQLDTCANDSIKLWMRCKSEREYTSELHLDFGMYLRNTWGLWSGSPLAISLYNLGIDHPDGMSTVILSAFYKRVNSDPKAIEHALKEYKQRDEVWRSAWGKKKAMDDAAVRRTQWFVDSVHKLIHYEEILDKMPGLVHDDNSFYISRRSGDTLMYWTTGSLMRETWNSYLDLVKSPYFGKTLFFGYIESDGGLFSRHLTRTRFIRRNDTLFFEDEKDPFIPVLVPRMLRQPTYQYYWNKTGGCSMSHSYIQNHWVYKGMDYYNLRLTGDCHGTGLKVGFIINSDLEVIFDETLKGKIWGTKPLFTGKGDGD
jgi:hypothetical protein